MMPELYQRRIHPCNAPGSRIEETASDEIDPHKYFSSVVSPGLVAEN
jgi:hypothetical protein